MTPHDEDPHLAVARARLLAWIGVDLGRGGVLRSVERCVARELAANPMSAQEYAMRLDRPASAEARGLIEAATVPHSWLFRDPSQLDALARTLLGRPPGRLRVLVAGCATGEDAYSVACVALRAGHDVEVVAFDVNDSALEKARRGRFGAFQSRDVPTYARAHFVSDPEDEATSASEALRRRIRFVRHSLVDAVPRPSDADAWDVVVCRNVLIYFERAHAIAIVARLARALAADGLLLLGASDVLAELPDELASSPGDGRAILMRSSACRGGDAPAPSAAAGSSSVGHFSPPLRIVTGAEREEPASWSLPPVASDRVARDTLAPAGNALAPGLERASRALDVGELEEARLALEAHLAGAPDDAEAWLLSGLVAFADERFTQAVDHCERACRSLPGAWVAWLHLGLAHERLGRWHEATSAFFRVPIASGEGEGLPRGEGELATTLRSARHELTRLALRRAESLQRGEPAP